VHPSSRAPLGALLLALLLRALPAPACSRLPPGHRHLFADPPAAGGPSIEIGACTGTAPAARPPEGAPLSLQALAAQPHWAGWRTSLRDLGYREDAASDRVLTPDGAPLSQEHIDWLMAPADAGTSPVPALAWQHLQVSGYRLDESDCSFRHPSQPAFTNIDLARLLSMAERGNAHVGLEALKSGLRGLPPGAPVPPELIARMRQMESAQVRLPDSLRRLLFSETPPRVSDVSASVDSAYAAATSYFDGQRDLASFVTAARAPGSPGAQAPRAPSTMRSGERRLGELLSRELQSLFESTEPGRELLRHFRRPDGSVVLPPVLVLKLTQRPDDPNQPGAVYNHETREVVMNHWEVQRAVLLELSAEERAAHGRELSDAAALGRFLAARPQLLRRVAERLDFAILHEFVHYRQGDASPILDEHRHGNVPGTLPQSLEHEAHRQECRYYLSRVAADPSLLLRGYGGNRQEYCAGVLQDPGRLEAYISDLYSRTFAGSQTLPEVRNMQAARRDDALAALTSLSSTWSERGRALLKLAGLRHGDDALAREQARISAERQAYDRSLAPLREQAAAVPGALLRLGRPYQALQFLSLAGWEGREDPAREALREAERLLGARDPRSSLDERLGSLSLIMNIRSRLGAADWTDDFKNGIAADMREHAGRLRTQAGSLTGEQAAALLQQAQQWDDSADTWSPRIRERAPEPPAPRQRTRRGERR
jgi:hypothetical protein